MRTKSRVNIFRVIYSVTLLNGVVRPTPSTAPPEGLGLLKVDPEWRFLSCLKKGGWRRLNASNLDSYAKGASNFFTCHFADQVAQMNGDGPDKYLLRGFDSTAHGNNS
jgi:hypothetical protein